MHIPAAPLLILGPPNLWNSLLAYALEKEIELPCRVVDSLPDPGVPPGLPPRPVLLIDLAGPELEPLLRDLRNGHREFSEAYTLALFNFPPGDGREQEALAAGVRGFFYSQELLPAFFSGIRALLAGQVWVPRAILVDCAIHDPARRPPGRGRPSGGNGLTCREKEILALLTTGAGNRAIADKLDLSPCTVKTRLYHLFRKIEVDNRFQAALWAAKHLR